MRRKPPSNTPRTGRDLWRRTRQWTLRVLTSRLGRWLVTDAGDFKIDGGVLSFAKSPNFEAPADADPADNTYMVTVQATDESNKVGMHEVTVEVTNVDEPGKVTLSALRPQSQTEFTATHTDPDGPDGPDAGEITDLKWQWAKSMTMDGSYSDIDKAIMIRYTPQDDDIDSYLRVTATYTDPEGSDKSAMARSAYKVQAVRGDNNAPVFPDEDGDEERWHRPRWRRQEPWRRTRRRVRPLATRSWRRTRTVTY